MSWQMVKTFFDQPINNDVKTYENIRKIATGQGDDYATGCLLDYPYFRENWWLQRWFKDDCNKFK